MVNLGNVTDSSNFFDLAFYINNAVDGLLFNGGLIVFFLIILIGSRKFDVKIEHSMAAASWSTFIISGMLWFPHLTSGKLTLMYLAFAAFATAYIYWKGD